jgi:hypothetical protein
MRPRWEAWSYAIAAAHAAATSSWMAVPYARRTGLRWAHRPASADTPARRHAESLADRRSQISRGLPAGEPVGNGFTLERLVKLPVGSGSRIFDGLYHARLCPILRPSFRGNLNRRGEQGERARATIKDQEQEGLRRTERAHALAQVSTTWSRTASGSSVISAVPHDKPTP